MNLSVLHEWTARCQGQVAMGGSLDRIDKPWPDVSPPLLWPLAPQARWALMEGDLSFTHVVAVDAFVGLRSGSSP